MEFSEPGPARSSLGRTAQASRLCKRKLRAACKAAPEKGPGGYQLDTPWYIIRRVRRHVQLLAGTLKTAPWQHPAARA